MPPALSAKVIINASTQRWEHLAVLRVTLAEEWAGRDQARADGEAAARDLLAGKTSTRS